MTAGLGSRCLFIQPLKSRTSLSHGQVTLDEGRVGAKEPAADVVTLDDALTALAAVDERKSQVVEVRYFGGDAACAGKSNRSSRTSVELMQSDRD